MSEKANKEDMDSHFEYMRQYIKGKLDSGEIFTILGNPERERAFSIGYQAATSDAKALVGELVEALKGNSSAAFQEALTKAAAWLSNNSPTDKE